MSVAPGIDHIVLCVRDLDSARRRFRSMGFTLTPPAMHPFGTGNCLAQMGSSFIELLTVVDPARIPPHDNKRFSFGAHNAEFLSRGEGMSMLVLSSDDAVADEARWKAAGLKTYEPVYFERKATLPDGSEAKVAFTIAFAVNERMPAAVFFCCQQHAPEAFWQRQFQRHPNGARDFAFVRLEAEEPSSQASFLETLFDTRAAPLTGNGLSIDTGLGRVEVMSPHSADKRSEAQANSSTCIASPFVGAGIAVDDLDSAQICLEQGGVNHARHSDRIIVPPAQCFGLELEFVPA